MQKSIPIASILAILTLVTLLVAIWRNEDLDAEVRDQVATIAAQVNQQTTVINRALGNVIPYKLPTTSDDRIKAIEDQVSDSTKWPTTTADADRLRQELGTAISDLPPWVQEELLPRLVPLRWDVEGLWLLTTDMPTTSDALSGQAATVEMLLSNRPSASSEVIADKLSKRSADTDVQISAADRANVLTIAKEALETRKDLDAALDAIGVYDDPEAKSLYLKLSDALVQESIDETLAQTKTDLETYSALQDSALRLYALDRLRAVVTDLQLRLSTRNLTDAKRHDEIDALQRDLTHSVATTRAAQVRKYQVWALNQIKDVRSYEKIKESEIDKISGNLDRYNPGSDAYKAAIDRARTALREDMITHMAMLDQGALDIAVSQWFRKVYEDRLSKLAEETYQIEVVTAFAMTPKQPVETLP